MKSGEFGPFFIFIFPLYRFWNHIFQVEIWRNFAQKKNHAACGYHPLFFTNFKKKKKKILLNFPCHLIILFPITLVDLIIFLNTRYFGPWLFFNKKILKKHWSFQVFFLFCFGGWWGCWMFLCSHEVLNGVPNRFLKFSVCSSTCSQ
jgi:hypothetical protein